MKNLLLPAWLELSILIIALLAVVAYAFNPKRNLIQNYRIQLAMLGLLYGIGVVLKVSGFGPDFVRFHLADIGFPVAFAWAATTFHSMRVRARLSDVSYPNLRLALEEAKFTQKAIMVTVPLAYAYELCAHILVKTSEQVTQDGQPSGIGQFDWIDIACYTIGGMLAYYLSRRFTRDGGVALSYFEAEDAKAKLTKKSEKRKQTRRSRNRKRR